MQHTVLSLAREDTAPASDGPTRFTAPCPNWVKGNGCTCDHNGFYMKQDKATGKWLFGCRGCWEPADFLTEETVKTVIGRKQVGDKRGMGDEINYLHHFRGMSYTQAKAFLDGQEATALPTLAQKVDPYLTDSWQEATHATLQAHIARLWGDDTAGLDYARGRGLKDETIRGADLAYSIHKGIPRLLFPVKNEGRYYAVYRRAILAEIPKGCLRWQDLDGGTKSELYLADILKIRPDYPVMLVEDAFSALSVWQEAGDLVNVVGTGSANCCKKLKWIARLARSPHVFITLDADEAGDKHSQFWLDRLKNASRLRPLLKDPNDMLTGGYSIREWIADALAARLANVCSVCGASCEETTDLFYYDAAGAMYCPSHWQALTGERVTPLVGRVEQPAPVVVGDAAREYAKKTKPELDREDFYAAIARNAARLKEQSQPAKRGNYA